MTSELRRDIFSQHQTLCAVTTALATSTVCQYCSNLVVPLCYYVWLTGFVPAIIVDCVGAQQSAQKVQKKPSDLDAGTFFALIMGVYSVI